jgi:hypothetical protein
MSWSRREPMQRADTAASPPFVGMQGLAPWALVIWERMLETFGQVPLACSARGALGDS